MAFDIGLGGSTYLGYIYGLPFLNRWGGQKKIVTRSFVTSPNFMVWLLKPRLYQKGPVVNKTITGETPADVKKFIISQIPVGIAWIILLGVTGDLILSKAWTSNLYYDILFAREAPGNGAHILTYLAIPAIGLVTIYVYRDVFLGLLVAAFFVAVHEGIWIVAYYLAYWPYITGADYTNLLADSTFCLELALFALTFIKYKGNPMKWHTFYWPIYGLMVFTIAWFLVPPIIDPSFYGYFPVSVSSIYNPAYFPTQYMETKYYLDAWTNGIEVFSWLFPAAWMSAIILRRKK
jgi:hypothetical protein